MSLYLKIISFFKKYLLVVAGLLMLIISLHTLYDGYLDKKMTDNNHLVLVEVLEAPENCNNLGRRGAFCKLKFNNKIFIKKVNKTFCKWVTNTTQVKMLANKKMNDIIFLNKHDESNNLFYGLLLSLVSLIIIYKGIKT